MDGRLYRVSLGFQREKEGRQKRDLCPLERSIPWRKTLFFFFSSFYKDRNHFLVPRDPPFSPLYIYLASETRVIWPVPRSRTVNFSKWKYSSSRYIHRERVNKIGCVLTLSFLFLSSRCRLLELLLFNNARRENVFSRGNMVLYEISHL